MKYEKKTELPAGFLSGEKEIPEASKLLFISNNSSSSTLLENSSTFVNCPKINKSIGLQTFSICGTIKCVFGKMCG